MWGTRGSEYLFLAKKRFIPTDVGNTVFNWNVYTLTAVHPHRCGEHYKSYNKAKIKDGSSPQMWGTLILLLLLTLISRFIPTDVGNTAIDGEFKANVPVHPHRCGEHIY